MMYDGKNLAAQTNAPTRRQAIIGAAVAFSGFIWAPAQAWAAIGEEISRTEESIHQEVTFKASRKRVYDALTITKQFDRVVELSGALQSMSLGTAPAAISTEVGGAFSIFGGHIVGRHLELVPGERIVQAWRVVNWDPGVYSIAKFQLVEQGSGAKLVFDHVAFPKGQAEHLAVGWKAHYWEPLEKFLASNRP